MGGSVTWLNEGLGQWVTWYPGSDAPPLPPGWEEHAASLPPAPLPAGSLSAPGAAASRTVAPPGEGIARPPIRSPYRLLPVVLVVGIVAVAIWQGTHPALKATPQDITQAKALEGKCLARAGGTNALPKYSATPVSCTSASAAAKVVAVLVPGAKGGPQGCARGDAAVQVGQPRVQGEPVECVAPVRHR